MNFTSGEPAPTHAIIVIRMALGYIYLHFGFLKFFTDLSPAEVLASYTTMSLTSYFMDAPQSLLFIAILECVIGVSLLLRVNMRLAGILFLLHMIGTFLPLFLLPELTYKFPPFAPTVEGQYILKNLVLVAAGWAVFAPYFSQKAADTPLKTP